MNKLILIGNGFDLAHNLKTKYCDFVLWYLNKCFNAVNNYNYNDDLLTIAGTRRFPMKEFDSISDFLGFIKLYEINVTYAHPFLENIVSSSIDYNWIDIEAKYFEFLKNLYKRVGKYNLENTRINEGSIPIRIKGELVKLNNCLDSIKAKLVEYLSGINEQSININEEIESHIFNEIHGTVNENASELKRQRILILNFNYTTTIQNYIPLNSNWPCEINYIHGKIDDKSNPIIFGYGDEMDNSYNDIEELNSNEFLCNFKSFGYFKTDNYQRFTKFMEEDYFNVFVIGHSCGLSDRILLNSIFEHRLCKQVKIFYHQKNDVENDYFEKTLELSRHYRPVDKGKMRNMIVPFSQSVPLVKYKNGS